MLLPLTSLKSDVARRVSLWEREVVTATETVGWLLDRFAFAVLDFPSELPVVAESLDAVPPVLIAGLSRRLAGCRIASGGWHWPPAGMGLPNPGPIPPWGVADPAQTAALEVVARWIRDRASTG
jgi:hypothetical protein